MYRLNNILYCNIGITRISVTSKPAVLCQKENGFTSSVTTYTADDLASDKEKRKHQTEERKGSFGRSQKQTRPLGQVRSGAQESLQLPELLPKLEEAVASKKPLKDNHLYSFEIEERTEDMTSGDVQVNRINNWVFVNRNSYYVVDDQDTRLPQIGGEGAKVIHRDRDKEFEAKLKLASPRSQHKAWKELSSKRTIQFPLQFQIEMDNSICEDKEVLQQTRDSIRKILESRIVSSSIPSRSRQTDLNYLTISNSGRNSVTRKNSLQHADPRRASSFSSTEKHSDEETTHCNLDESQEIDDYIIESYCNHGEKKTLNERLAIVPGQSKNMTPRHETILGENDTSYVCSDDNDGALSIVTSRPTSSIRIPSLPDTEGRTSRYGPERNESNQYSNTAGSDPVMTRPVTSADQSQCPGQNQNRTSSARPTWPSLIDIQRLKSGGFRYKPSTSRGGATNTGISSTRLQTVTRQKELSLKDPPINKLGTIIVPSHTTLDCPLCNLYAEEHSDCHENNTSVYQQPGQVKSLESTKRNSLRTKQRKPANKTTGVSSSTSGSHSTTVVINKVASKQIEVMRQYSERAFPQRRPKSAMVLSVKKNPYSFINQSVQIPVVSTYDQIEHCKFRPPDMDAPCRFSYVKAPSYVNNE